MKSDYATGEQPPLTEHDVEAIRRDRVTFGMRLAAAEHHRLHQLKNGSASIEERVRLSTRMVEVEDFSAWLGGLI